MGQRGSCGLRTAVSGLLLGMGLYGAPVALSAAEEPDWAKGPVPPGASQLSYEFYLGGLHAMTLEMQLPDTHAEHYRARAHMRLDGVFDTFFEFWLSAESEGQRAESALLPKTFRTENQWSGKEVRWVEIAYDADRRPLTRSDPPPGEDEREPVDPTLTLGTVDPLSGLITLLETAARLERCDGATAVFDGRRRFDVSLRDDGETELKPSGYSLYHGPARLCRIVFDRVVGLWSNPERLERYPDAITIALAPVADGGPPVPVRAELENKWGAIRVHLVAARRGAERAALEN